MARKARPRMGADHAANLRALRDWKGLSLRQLEEEIFSLFPTGISNANLSRMERGKQPIGPVTAKKLAKFFGVKQHDLCSLPS